MSLLRLSRFGVAILLLAQSGAAFSQAAPPTPAEQTGQTQEQSPGQPADDTPLPAQNPNGDQGETPAPRGGHVAEMPAPLNIDSSSLEFAGERTRGSYLRGGVGVGTSYESNLLSSTSAPVGGLSYSVAPSIEVDISQPRLFVETSYEGGYTFNQRFSAYNQAEHNALLDLRYRVSPHVNFRVYDRFVLSTGFFNQLQGSGGLGSGPVQQPNLGVITPFTRRTDDLGTAELTYQYSPSDTVGGSVTGNISAFAKPPTGATTLLNTLSLEGDAFYSHRFTARQSSGIAYTFLRLSFDPVSEIVDTHTILLFHTIHINPNLVISIFGGPEYTQFNMTSGATALGRWSGGGGGTVNWKLRRTSLRASGTRKVSDGGGLIAAADVTSGLGAIRQQLTRSSTLELGVLYAGSHALDPGITSFTDVKVIAGSVQWEQAIGRNLTATLGFSRDNQKETATALALQNTNHNRGWVTIAYRFTRPLGR